MSRIKLLVFLLIFLLSQASNSQIKEYRGIVIANSDLEGIHVINKTSKFYTITNQLGEFSIKGKLSDTLIFSSVQYKLLSIKLTPEVYVDSKIRVKLEDHINQLDEIFIGNELTGDLHDDIKNNKVKPEINFYNVGIPGYVGKPITINERRLFEADHGKYFKFYGVGFAINVNKILNKVSGRTDRLKYMVQLDKKDELMFRIKSKLSEEFFNVYPLEKEKQIDFFFFCAEDKNFLERCSTDNDLLIIEYLKQKLSAYKSNLLVKE